MLRTTTHTRAPSAEVRQVMRTEMRKRRDPFGRSIRVEYDLNQPEKAVVFNDEFKTGS
jgi:hypothetical protein